MRTFRPSLGLLFLAATACGARHAVATGPQATTRGGFVSSDDSAIATALEAHGRRFESKRAIVWFTPDSLPEGTMRALADRIGRELGEMKDYLGGPYSWQRFPDPRVTYYFAPGRFISHADYAARVFIPLRRVGQGSDLFLHETAHVLVTLRTITAWELPDSLPDKRDRVARTERRWPLWLDEGFASYASQDVAAMHGYAPDDIMGAGGNAHVDAACARWLRTDDGRAVLRWIGAPGMPPRVETDREHVAKPFYVCAQSFCKFLASRIGRRALTQANGAMDGDPNVEIARTAGVDMESLRAEWLASIGASATSSTRP